MRKGGRANCSLGGMDGLASTFHIVNKVMNRATANMKIVLTI